MANGLEPVAATVLAEWLHGISEPAPDAFEFVAGTLSDARPYVDRGCVYLGNDADSTRRAIYSAILFAAARLFLGVWFRDIQPMTGANIRRQIVRATEAAKELQSALFHLNGAAFDPGIDADSQRRAERDDLINGLAGLLARFSGEIAPDPDRIGNGARKVKALADGFAHLAARDFAALGKSKGNKQRPAIGAMVQGLANIWAELKGSEARCSKGSYPDYVPPFAQFVHACWNEELLGKRPSVDQIARALKR